VARFNKTLKTIMEAMNSTSKEKTKAYDTPATVLRVDGDTLWVHIDGGVDETPIKRTIDAKVGDVVQVRVGGGRAWATGNASAPPTDDTKAGIALEQTNAVSKAVKTVKTLVDKVTKIAGDTAQYFWHTQEGTDTGVHITEVPKEDFLADPENGGGNLLARSNGIAVRDGLTELAQFGAVINLGTGDTTDQNIEIDPARGIVLKRGSAEITKIGYRADDGSGGLNIDNPINESYVHMASDGINVRGSAFSFYDPDSGSRHYRRTNFMLPATNTSSVSVPYSGSNRAVLLFSEQWSDSEGYHIDDIVHYFDRDGLTVEGDITATGKLTADLSNMIAVEEKSITYSNSWTSVYKAGYRLLSVHAIRSDVDYIIQANRRSDGVYLLYAPNAGSASQNVELIWLKD